MTSFDLRVQQWLTKSTVPTSDKISLMQKTVSGLASYRAMTTKETPTDQPIRLNPKFVIQWSVLDTYQRTIRKLQEGDDLAITVDKPVDEAPPQAGFDLGTFKFGQPKSPMVKPPTGWNDEEPDDEGDHEGMFKNNCVVIVDDDSAVRQRYSTKTLPRQGISAEQIKSDEIASYQPVIVPKSSESTVFLTQTLQGHTFFQHLEDQEISTVVGMLQVSEHFPNDVLFCKGDDMSVMYIVGKGSVKGANTEYKRGDSLLDNCLMYTEAASETVSVTGEAQMYYLPQRDYKLYTAQCSLRRREKYSGFLSKVKFLSALTIQERLQLADGLRGQSYIQGDHLIRFGEDGKWFMLILEGIVEVIGRDKQGQKVPVCEFQAGNCVGELEFLYQHKTVADCVAKTQTVRVAQMTKSHFEKLMGPAKEVLERNANTSEVYKYYRSARSQVFGDEGKSPAK